MKKLQLLIACLVVLVQTNAQKSMGFSYDKKETDLVVNKVFKTGPAEKAGIVHNDIILSVNNTTIVGLTADEAAKVFIDAADNCTIEVKRKDGSKKKLLLIKADKASYLNKCLTGDCKNGKSVYIDNNGLEYTGNYVNRKLNGMVTVLYPSGKIYKSNYVDSKSEGKIVLKEVLPNGDMYDGETINGLYDGQGTFTASNGATYTGVFKKGKFDGPVIQTYNNKVTTVIYKDGEEVSSNKAVTNKAANTNPNAKIEIINYKNGDVFEGYKVNGVKAGKGKYTYNAGGYYDGNWANDSINGFGKYDNGKGLIYEGNWKNYKKDGIGKLTEKNGNVTEQNWTNGKLNGKTSSKVFEKEVLLFTIEEDYVDNIKSPNPKVIYPNGNIYEGEWLFGTPYGMGQYTYKNGDVEKGYFGRGMRYGLIELKTKKGKISTNYYRNDTLVGNFNKGKLLYKNGDVFEGQFKDGREDGEGKLTTKNEKLTGNWVKGYLQGIAISTSKTDGTATTYKYLNGEVTSESLNANKFTTQIISLMESAKQQFENILISKNDNTYKLKDKLNGFTNCNVKYYAPNISNTGLAKWVYVAETSSMTKAESIAFCKQLEAILDKSKFYPPLTKSIEYDVATRRLINYSTNSITIINVDTGGEGDNWTVEVRINAQSIKKICKTCITV